MLNVAILIGTYGSPEWSNLAFERAIPSANEQQKGYEDNIRVCCRHAPRGTLAGVRNDLAAHEAMGADWLLFLDADDELAPGYVDAMEHALLLLAHGDSTRHFDHPGFPLPPVLLAPAVQYVHPDGREEEPRIPNEGRWPEVNECVIGTIVSRDLFLAVGGFGEYDVYEDYALWLACERAGARIVHVPDAVYRAHVRQGSRNVSATYALTTYNEIRRQDRWAREGR